MKKVNNKGFVLLETLVVTIFISGVLIFLFSQFSSLSRSYEESYKYNKVDGIYALNNISKYILDDWELYNKIDNNTDDYINITDCSIFTNVDYCKKLFEYENIDTILVTKNNFDKEKIVDYDDDLLLFIKKIQLKSNTKEKYRLIAKFKDDTFATMRFGDTNE